jgi:hypothetical protein
VFLFIISYRELSARGWHEVSFQLTKAKSF